MGCAPCAQRRKALADAVRNKKPLEAVKQAAIGAKEIVQNTVSAATTGTTTTATTQSRDSTRLHVEPKKETDK